MDKESIVVDVNLFLASFFFGSKIGDNILNSIRQQIFALLSCDEFRSELQTKIYHFKNKVSETEFFEIQEWFDFLSEISQNIVIKSKLKICRDPNDDYLINLALDGNAKYLITRDKDLLEVEYSLIKDIVVTPEKFMNTSRELINSGIN